jgi:diaminohydroxyphosphoribosylaminopyrimidine deaminase / 5-amino-6-(5-phosphoribosylamino)uracil reductase
VIDFDQEIPEQICDILYKHDLQSIIIEGGAKTLQSFIDVNLWDEARILTGEKSIGSGTPAPVIQGETRERSFVYGDKVEIFSPSRD